MKLSKKMIVLIICSVITLSFAVPTLAKYVLQNKLENILAVPEVFYYSETEEEFNYTGDYQVYVAPEDGEYFIELWGAGGGGNSPGSGAYTSGYIRLSKGEKLYVYVGSKGETGDKGITGAGGYNGGGAGGDSYDATYDGGHGGGGATDVRLVSGEWNNLTSLRSRIMVAAGGGGGYGWDNGGAAGGLEGYNTSGNLITVATQTSTSFGIGENGASKTISGSGGAEGNCGGGGGYYGGGASSLTGENSNAGGGGGSSFISGHDGCIAINEDGNAATDSIHYSSKYFYNTTMIDGQGYNWTNSIQENVGMPSNSAAVAQNGYAKILLYSKITEEQPTEVFTIRTEKYGANSDGKYIFEDTDGILKFKTYDELSTETNPEAYWYMTSEGYIRNYATNNYVYMGNTIIESQDGSSTYEIEPYGILTSAQVLGDGSKYKWTIQSVLCEEPVRIEAEGSSGEAFVIYLTNSGGLNSDSKQLNSGRTKGAVIGFLSAATVNKDAWTSSCGRHWVIDYTSL